MNHLVIRPVITNDVREVAKMWKLNEGPISLEEAKNVITWLRENHSKNKIGAVYHACFGIFKKNGQNIIGWCGLDGRDGKQTNIFYLIDKFHRKKGFGTLAAQTMLKYGFEIMKLQKIHGECTIENIGSQKILEKIGMQPLQHKSAPLNKRETTIKYMITNLQYQEVNQLNS